MPRSWWRRTSTPTSSAPSRARCRGPTPWSRPARIKAELAFRSLDVDCAIANEGSYGPIDAVPLVPSGVEIMAFLDRKRGIRIIETLSDASHQLAAAALQGGRSQHPQAVKAIGFPRYGVFVLCSSDMDHPIKRAGHPGRRRRGDEPGGQALGGRHGRAVSPTCAPIAIRRACACCARSRGSSPSAWNGSARNAMRRASARSATAVACRARVAPSPPTGCISRSTAARSAATPRRGRARTGADGVEAFLRELQPEALRSARL